MIKKVAFVGIFVLSALLARYGLGQVHGRRAVLITEFKYYSGRMLALTQWETNHPPELKEFVKAHYYRLANQIPGDWAGSPSNYGPVSTTISHLTAFKGPSNAHWNTRNTCAAFRTLNPDDPKSGVVVLNCLRNFR